MNEDRPPHPATPLAEVRDWTRDRAREGVECPCCTQLVKVYRRRVNRSMVRALLTLYRSGGTAEFRRPPDLGLGALGGDTAKLALFGLIEESPERREDGGRAGWWRVTLRGEAFLKGETEVREYALVYDGRRLGWDGGWVSVSDAWREPFRLDELLAS